MAGNSGSNDQTIINSPNGRKETKNLIDAVSEIQVFSVGEAQGAEIGQNYFTWQMNIEFFSVGFKAFIAGFIICLPLVPMAVGVAYGMIPVYGGTANLYDKIFMFILAFSVSFGALVILSTASKYVYGITTHQMAKSLYTGALISALIKGFLLFIIFQVIAAMITPDIILKYLNAILALAPKGTLFQISSDIGTSSNIVAKVKPVFRVASMVTLVFSFVASMAICFCWWRMRSRYLNFKHIKEYIDKGDA